MHNYLYSPLSPQTEYEKNNRVILLLFILKEIVKNMRLSQEEASYIGPFGWTQRGTSFQKLEEHLTLLPFAFPEFTHLMTTLKSNLSTEELFSRLEPLILSCQTSENLLLFLVRHQKELAVKPILDKICPQGLDAVKEKIADGYRKRGYPFTRWTHSSKTP